MAKVHQTKRTLLQKKQLVSMSLGCLSPGDYTIWQIRGREGFINSLEGIQWYEVSESSNYANCFTNFLINTINVLLLSQIVINEHSQVLNVSLAFQGNELFWIMVEKF